MFHQPRPDGIHEHVFDNALKDFIASQGVVMKTRSPQRPASPHRSVHTSGRT
jgi:hypothetical protein